MSDPTLKAANELEGSGYDGVDAVAYAILRLAHATEDLAYQVKYLGNGNAASQMGAIEFLSKTIADKMDDIVSAMFNERVIHHGRTD